MTVVYHELLPFSYLLILAPGTPDGPELALGQYLTRAARSGKRAVWVDCRLLTRLPAAAAGVLCAHNNYLREEGLDLVLFNVAEQVRQDLLSWRVQPGFCIVGSMDEAARVPSASQAA
jgi:anti-anti-sigma regulatory factor